MNLTLDLDFGRLFTADAFFFGVANAPYLSEGGYNTVHGPKNSYGWFEAAGTVPVSGESTRFWTDYRRQIGLAAQLGLNAFRLGVDWSRLRPTTTLAPGDQPAWSEEALARYVDIVGCVQDHGMAPIVTLHHFTHPAWAGPLLWDSDAAVELVAEHEIETVVRLNTALSSQGRRPVDHLITFNELNLVPLLYFVVPFSAGEGRPRGLRQAAAGYDRMLRAHIAIYDGVQEAFTRLGWPRPTIGFGTASLAPYELDKLLLDVVRLRADGVEPGDVADAIAQRRQSWRRRIDALAAAKLTDAQRDAYEAQCASAERAVTVDAFEATLQALYQSPLARKIDYISANVYEPFGFARSEMGAKPAPEWWDNAADTDVYATYIRAYNDHNLDLPLHMGENSLAYRKPVDGPAERRPDGCSRERYLKSYVMEMVKAMREGVRIEGYLYWSIIDDFEWEAGFEPRLGLYHYDYLTHTIDDTDALGEPAGDIYATLVAALRSGDKARIQRTFTTTFDALAEADRVGRATSNPGR
jgi:beta-glucosidase/6-phospho-beta-glucosidase/beta-galactosidase